MPHWTEKVMARNQKDQKTGQIRTVLSPKGVPALEFRTEGQYVGPAIRLKIIIIGLHPKKRLGRSRGDYITR